jgi:alpha-L-fucosidase
MKHTVKHALPLLAALVLAGCSLLPAGNLLAADAAPLDWPAANPAAVAHWRDLRFGMFIHWGPVSLTGKEIGWSRGKPTPIDVYDNLYKQFNPTNFNADEWVSIARAAGMKYIVLTTKHHDGFCLWDTKLADYNIMNTPFHRDVVKELAVACKKQGIEFGAYYSTCDWYNTNWPATSPGGTIKRETSDMDAYEKYLQGQISELITNYGPLITIWNDVPNRLGANYGKRGADTIKLVRKLQPDILINNRTGDGGDYDTPEQKIGKFQFDRPWESCMTVSAHNHWAWGGENDGVKPLSACLDMLICGAGGDGNILLNVGPRPDGKIDPAQANLLEQMGGWLAKNGEAIYGTRGGPWEPAKDIASTRKGNVVYLHVMKSENGRVELPALPRKIKSASVLGGGEIKTEVAEGKYVLHLPAKRDPLVTVIKLELDGSAMDIPAMELPVAVQSQPADMEPVKAFCVDFNWGPGGKTGFAPPGLWADADPAKHMAWYDELGVNVIQSFAVSCNGYAWYKGGKIPPQPGLVHDFLPELVKLGHAKNKKVMGYFCIGANSRWGLEQPKLSYGAPATPHIPFTDEYLDYLSTAIEEGLTLTGMDGFMIDWVWNPNEKLRKEEWLPAEQKLFAQLMGKSFPGMANLTAADKLKYEQLAIDRCWERIRSTAKRVKPDCVIWLSCNKIRNPSIASSRLLREVDWVMDESGTPDAMRAAASMFGPQTRQLLCVVGWGDRHNARKIVTDTNNGLFSIYGFAKPKSDSLPLPVDAYLNNPIDSFKGNDRNIAVLARWFNCKTIEPARSEDSTNQPAHKKSNPSAN